MTPIKTTLTFNDMNTVNSAIKMPVLVRYDIPTYPQGESNGEQNGNHPNKPSRAAIQPSLCTGKV